MKAAAAFAAAAVSSLTTACPAPEASGLRLMSAVPVAAAPASTADAIIVA